MLASDVMNRLPNHLRQYCIDQPYASYTCQDHAVWRFVMRQNVDFLSQYAHPTYIKGLQETGISIEQIPDIETMNRILSKIGWAAVTVDGFIPPAAFMEFQANKVLVIAADIRPFDQIGYTPAPDIIHEAAGHAPIIADSEYAEYLRYFGEIGSKAISSANDYVLYEAIRHLSILKADPNTKLEEIDLAEQLLRDVDSKMGIPSEMALIRNLHWWTVEYGLVGNIENPSIYGAGLLSSIEESKGALSADVIKIPYSIDAALYNFDITKPQPQLFVTPDFGHLIKVLDEFADRMAFRKGGVEGIMKAVSSNNIATVRLSSGIQISGIFSDYLLKQNEVVYFRTNSPSAISYENKQIDGHGMDYHEHGYSTPVGRIVGINKPPRLIQDSDLTALGIILNKQSQFTFESGLIVKGILQSVTRRNENLLMLSFSECTVEYENSILFKPEWGIYDMAIGESIVSVANGPADPDNFGVFSEPPKETTHKIIYRAEDLQLFSFYKEIRDIREGDSGFKKIPQIWEKLNLNFDQDWLLPLEILEILVKTNLYPEIQKEITHSLSLKQNRSTTHFSLIGRGIALIKK
jgi:phenylalanine-4-hydroxylase